LNFLDRDTARRGEYRPLLTVGFSIIPYPGAPSFAPFAKGGTLRLSLSSRCPACPEQSRRECFGEGNPARCRCGMAVRPACRRQGPAVASAVSGAPCLPAACSLRRACLPWRVAGSFSEHRILSLPYAVILSEAKDLAVAFAVLLEGAPSPVLGVRWTPRSPQPDRSPLRLFCRSAFRKGWVGTRTCRSACFSTLKSAH
jgi:hypothetical protein